MPYQVANQNPYQKKLQQLRHQHLLVIFFQFEGRDAKRQQTANFRITVVDDGFDAVSYQDIGTTQTCGPGADDWGVAVDPVELPPL